MYQRKTRALIDKHKNQTAKNALSDGTRTLIRYASCAVQFFVHVCERLNFFVCLQDSIHYNSSSIQNIFAAIF